MTLLFTLLLTYLWLICRHHCKGATLTHSTILCKMIRYIGPAHYKCWHLLFAIWLLRLTTFIALILFSLHNVLRFHDDLRSEASIVALIILLLSTKFLNVFYSWGCCLLSLRTFMSILQIVRAQVKSLLHLTSLPLLLFPWRLVITAFLVYMFSIWCFNTT